MKKFALVSIVLGLTACASVPQQSLEEQLKGKSPSEQKKILTLACLNEAEHVSPHKDRPYVHGYAHPYNKGESELKDICREMEKLPNTKGGK